MILRHENEDYCVNYLYEVFVLIMLLFLSIFARLRMENFRFSSETFLCFYK